jgi:hypothetical protein
MVEGLMNTELYKLLFADSEILYYVVCGDRYAVFSPVDGWHEHSSRYPTWHQYRDAMCNRQDPFSAKIQSISDLELLVITGNTKEEIVEKIKEL